MRIRIQVEDGHREIEIVESDLDMRRFATDPFDGLDGLLTRASARVLAASQRPEATQ